MDKPQDKRTSCYQIKVVGVLDKSWVKWFLGLSISSEKDPQGRTITTLNGQIRDQAELRGILTKLWDLNLVLLSVERTDF